MKPDSSKLDKSVAEIVISTENTAMLVSKKSVLSIFPYRVREDIALTWILLLDLMLWNMSISNEKLLVSICPTGLST